MKKQLVSILLAAMLVIQSSTVYFYALNESNVIIPIEERENVADFYLGRPNEIQR